MGPVGSFIAAIFVGAGTGASAAYIFAVNVARLGLLALSAKVFTPKVDLTSTAVQKGLTVRDPIAPQAYIYGEDLISGPVIFTNVGGTDNLDLYMTVAMTGHEIDSVQGYRLDDEDITPAQLSGAQDGNVIGGKYNGVASVELRLGTLTQTAPTKLTSAFSTLFGSNHTGRGWSHMTWEFNLVEGQEDVFSNGPPQNLRALIRGRKVYDPRLDDTNGGTGPHRLSDPTTWEWSSNNALCLADFIRDDKFGMREDDERIDWPLVIAAANICDQTVTVPGGTQTRYTCNVTFLSTERRESVRDELINSMLGRLVFSQGKWKMWAGAALTSDVTLTEANLRGKINMEAQKPSLQRKNRCRGKFVDASRNYTANSYPEIRSPTFEAEDGGEVKELVADFSSTNNTFEAQRKGILSLRKEREQRTIVFEGNHSCFRVQPGSVVTLDVGEWGFSGEKFFVTEWRYSDDGIDLTMISETDSLWNDPVEAEYTTRSPTGILVFGETGVPAVTNGSVVAKANGNLCAWTDPPRGTFDQIEIWASRGINDRSLATLVGISPGQEFFHATAGLTDEWFYWYRARKGALVSAYHPDLTTTTITTSNLSDGRPAINYDPDFDFSTGLGGENYWIGKIFGDASSGTFNSSGGVGNSAYVALVAATTTGQNPFALIGSTRRFRTNATTLEIVIRYRTSSAANLDHFTVSLRPYDTETGGVAGSPIVWPNAVGGATIPGTNNTWQTIRIPFQIPDSAAARFFDIDFGIGPDGGAIDVDSVFVYASVRPFDEQAVIGNVDASGNDVKLAGLVPEATTALSNALLAGNGEWRSRTLARRDSRYDFDPGTAMVDPGSGQIRYNSGSTAAITRIAIHEVSDEGSTMFGILVRMDLGTLITAEYVGNFNVVQVFEVINTPIDRGSWWEIPVRVIESGTLPSANNNITVTFDLSHLPRGGRPNIQNGNYTITQNDLDGIVQKDSGGAGETWTIPSNASQGWQLGSMFMGVNRGGGNLTLALTSDTLRNVLTGATGSQTIPDDKSFVAWKVASTEWHVSISP